MNLSIRTKLILIFLGFLSLISGSVYATSVALESQAVNISLLDLAAQQRAEVNNIARSVIGMQTETRQNVYYLELLELDEAVGNMGDTLEVLLNGGTFFMISTWTEIPVAMQMINAGYFAPAATVLLVLPPVSLPCLMILGGALGKFRVVGLLSAAVILIGIVAGLLFI
jgi:hypothetical protein